MLDQGGTASWCVFQQDRLKLQSAQMQDSIRAGKIRPLRHGEDRGEWVPRLAQALVGTKVVGVDAGDRSIVLTPYRPRSSPVP